MASLKVQSATLLIAKSLGLSFNIILPLLIVRAMDANDVGVYRQVFLLVTNAAAILPLGFSLSAFYFLNREGERGERVIANIVFFNTTMGGIAFALLLFFPGVLGAIFNNTDVTVLAPEIGLLIWLWVVSSFLETAALANQEVSLASAFIVVGQFSKLVFMGSAVFLFATVESFVYAAILQCTLQIGILIIYLVRRHGYFWRFLDLRFFRQQLTYALPFGLASLVYIAQTDIHNYFVSYGFGPVGYAIYSQGCFQLPLIAILFESVSAIFIPRMSRLQSEGNRPEMLALTVAGSQKLALVYFPLFVFLMVVSWEFITTLFTDQYSSSVPIFRINILTIPLFAIFVDPVIRAFEQAGKFVLKVRLVLLSVLILGLGVTIGRVSLEAIITIVVAIFFIEKSLTTWKAFRLLEINRADVRLFRGLALTGLAAVLSGLVLLVCYLTLSQSAREANHELVIWLLPDAIANSAENFVTGVLFLATFFALYVPMYLSLLYLFGLVEKPSRDMLTRRILRRVT